MNIIENIIEEIQSLSMSVDEKEMNKFLSDLFDALRNCDHIVGLGAGRMGYSLRAFIMRLTHIGFSASMIGDTNVPRIGQDSIVIINSSSGETPSMILYANQAKTAGTKIFLLTTNGNSTLAKLSDSVLIYGKGFHTKQIMKTAYEQFSYLLLDMIAAEIIANVTVPISEIEHNHSILE